MAFSGEGETFHWRGGGASLNGDAITTSAGFCFTGSAFSDLGASLGTGGRCERGAPVCFDEEGWVELKPSSEARRSALSFGIDSCLSLSGVGTRDKFVRAALLPTTLLACRGVAPGVEAFPSGVRGCSARGVCWACACSWRKSYSISEAS